MNTAAHTEPLRSHVQRHLEHSKSSCEILGTGRQCGDPALLLQVRMQRTGPFMSEEVSEESGRLVAPHGRQIREREADFEGMEGHDSLDRDHRLKADEHPRDEYTCSQYSRPSRWARTGGQVSSAEAPCHGSEQVRRMWPPCRRARLAILRNDIIHQLRRSWRRAFERTFAHYT